MWQNDISKQFLNNRYLFPMWVGPVQWRASASVCTLQLGLQTIQQMIPLLSLIIVLLFSSVSCPQPFLIFLASLAMLASAWEMWNSMYNIIVFCFLTSFRILDSMIWHSQAWLLEILNWILTTEENRGIILLVRAEFSNFWLIRGTRELSWHSA